MTRQIAVPSLSRLVTAAAALKVTNGSITSKYSFVNAASPWGWEKRRFAGMCECSATHSESKPRSSSATAKSVGAIEYSVKKIAAPIFIVIAPLPTNPLEVSIGGYRSARQDPPYYCSDRPGGGFRSKCAADKKLLF